MYTNVLDNFTGEGRGCASDERTYVQGLTSDVARVALTVQRNVNRDEGVARIVLEHGADAVSVMRDCRCSSPL